MAAYAIQYRRGTTTQHNSFTGLLGEVTVDTDKNTLVVHDGSTRGGFPLAREGAASNASSGSFTSNVTVGGTFSVTSTASFTDDVSITGDLDMSGHIIPSVDSDGTTGFDLGSPDFKWRDLYLSQGSLYVDGQKVIESDSGTIVVQADPDQSLTTKVTGTGVLTFQAATSVNMAATLQMQTGKKITDQGGNAVVFGDKLDMDNNQIINIGTPTEAGHATTKGYVDQIIGNISTDAITEGDSQIEIADLGTGTVGITVDGTQRLALSATEAAFTVPVTVNGDELAKKSYVDSAVASGGYSDSDVADYLANNQTFFNNIRRSHSSATVGTWADPFNQVNGQKIGLTESIIWPSAVAPSGSYKIVEIKGQAITGTLHAEFFPDVIKPGYSTGGDDVKLEPNTGGVVDVSNSKISNVSTPTDTTDAATKGYVDSATSAAATDATSKADAAEASAIATASADATAKADAAEASAISAVTNGAGAAFDTLKEIQDAMATDAELSSAIASVTTAAASTASADATSKANAAQSAAISAAASDATSKANAALASALAADSDTTYSAGSGLDLSGTTFSIESDLRGEAWIIGRSSYDYINVNTQHIEFFLDGNEEMRLYNSGDLHVDGNIIAYSNTISDERLKTDIVKIDSALDKVGQINGYTFTYTADGKKSAGVIAQEVEKVLPSAITESTLPLKMGEDDKTEYKTVQYDQLIGLLIEAVKELKAEVAELKGA